MTSVDASRERHQGSRRDSTESIDKELDWLIESEEREMRETEGSPSENKVSRELTENEKDERHRDEDSRSPASGRGSVSPSQEELRSKDGSPQYNKHAHANDSPRETLSSDNDQSDHSDHDGPVSVNKEKRRKMIRKLSDTPYPRSPSPGAASPRIGSPPAGESPRNSTAGMAEPDGGDRITSPESGDKNKSDDEYDDYANDDIAMTPDQQQAMMELHRMKLDLAYTEDETPPEYDVTERVRQLNEELAKEPTPDEDERERSIKFKENLIDTVAPPMEFSDDDEDPGKKEAKGQQESRGQNDSGDEAEENRGDNDPSARSGSGSGAGEKRRSRPDEEEKILVERNGSFELISTKDLSAEERQLYGVEETKDDDDDGDANSRTSSNGTGDGNESHDPHPPPAPRPTTANGTVRGGSAQSRRRVQSAQPQSSAEADDWYQFNYNSPYALTPEQKKEMGKEQRQKDDKSRKDKDKQQKDEDRKKQDSNDAFQAWLRTKREDTSQRRKKEHEQKKKDEEEKQNKKDDPEGAFNEWLQHKRDQHSREQREDRERQKEFKEGWYTRPRQDCDKAFKEWLKKKNADVRKAHSDDKQRSRIHKLLARRSRKSQQLARDIKQAQSFRYVDYYGYRF